MVLFCSEIEILKRQLSELIGAYSSVFVLCDENTQEYCLPLIRSSVATAEVISISSGEENKTLQTCERIWSALTDRAADRKSLLINLGGGVITDIGGFAASCYKRGVDFINIPTTLLAMVDASVGGKTGIDFHHFKNQIGVFNEAKVVLICSEFLKTLDARQLRSGLAEMVKHYLIADGPAFIDFSREGGTHSLPDITLIGRSVGIKSNIVAQDPLEENVRKKLNFGHTIGHALESYSMSSDAPLLHGEAIAYGMAIETRIAAFRSLIDEETSGFICQSLVQHFELKAISEEQIDDVLRYTQHDKKNSYGKVKMALIDALGSCRIDEEVTVAEMRTAIEHFNKSLADTI